jgi:nucleoside-diphosphate-sugar epimerase
MKIVVTGLTGFVGKNLKAHLEKSADKEIIALNFREKLPAMLVDSDAVIHLAGKAHDLKGTADDNEYFEVNYRKTKQLFDLFLSSKAKDFVYFSSVKAAADTVSGILLETDPTDPKTPYGQSKQLAEKYLLDQALPAGKRVFILRPCMIHGPANKGNLNLLYKLVSKGIPYPLASFENNRSFLSVSNLLYVVERLLDDRAIPAGIYNLADDLPLSTNEVIRIISEGVGQRPKLWRLPAGLVNFMAKAGDAVHLPLNSERLKKLTESYVVSNEKIKSVLNIESMPVSSKAGLLTTVRSFQNK